VTPTSNGERSSFDDESSEALAEEGRSIAFELLGRSRKLSATVADDVEAWRTSTSQSQAFAAILRASLSRWMLYDALLGSDVLEIFEESLFFWLPIDGWLYASHWQTRSLRGSASESTGLSRRCRIGSICRSFKKHLFDRVPPG